MKKLLKFVVFALVLTTPLFAANGPSKINWYTNYKEAAAEAKKVNKPMLLFFQGSDWCGPCKRLKREVFEKPAFAQAVGDRFIFVAVDFPRDKKKQSEEITAQNKDLAKKYSIAAYPTLIILNADGMKIAQMGYSGETPTNFADRLKSKISSADEVATPGLV